MEKAYIDLQGKYVILLYTIGQQRCIIVAVYIPPPFSVGILNKIMGKIIQYLPAKLLFIGDFNSVLSVELDRPRSSRRYSADLYNWAQATGVTEIWR